MPFGNFPEEDLLRKLLIDGDASSSSSEPCSDSESLPEGRKSDEEIDKRKNELVRAVEGMIEQKKDDHRHERLQLAKLLETIVRVFDALQTTSKRRVKTANSRVKRRKASKK